MDTAIGVTYQLPDALRSAFSPAVKIRRITELHTYIDALKNLGAVGESMAQHLRASARKYDIRTIQEILAEVGIE